MNLTILQLELLSLNEITILIKQLSIKHSAQAAQHSCVTTTHICLIIYGIAKESQPASQALIVLPCRIIDMYSVAYNWQTSKNAHPSFLKTAIVHGVHHALDVRTFCPARYNLLHTEYIGIHLLDIMQKRCLTGFSFWTSYIETDEL